MRDQKNEIIDLYSEAEKLKNQNFNFENKVEPDIMTDVNKLMKKVYGETRHKLYDVGRNDFCPCGSGKKYKKCCGRVRAEHGEEYYVDKLSETDNLDEAYQILTEAEKNHPLDIGFIVELILMSAQKRDLKTTKIKLLKLWRLLKEEMGENLIMMLLSLLLEDNEMDKINEIENCLQIKKIDNPDLLLFLSLFNALDYDLNKAVDYLQKALNKDDSPQQIKIMMHVMYYLYELENYDVMFDFWLNNFEKLNKLVEQYGLKKIPIVSSLRQILINSFGYSNDRKFTSKSEVRNLADIFLKLNQNIEAIDDEMSKDEIDGFLTEIDLVIDQAAYDSILYLMLLERLIGIEYYSAAEKYVNQAADFNQKNSEYLMLKARLNYYLENLGQAEKDINKALKYYSSKSQFDKLTLMADKLLILMEKDNFTAANELLKEIKIESDIPLLSALAKGLSPHPIRISAKLFKSLLKLKKAEIIDQKRLKITILYYLFMKRDMLALSLSEIKDDFKEVLSAVSDKENNQLAQMAEIYLKSENLSEEESLEKLEKINQKQAEFTEEAEIKFEYNLKLRNYDYLLQEEYFAEEKRLLQDADFAFYKIIALLNKKGIEKALTFLKELSSEQGTKVFQRMLQEGDSFLKEEKLLEEIKARDIF